MAASPSAAGSNNAQGSPLRNVLLSLLATTALVANSAGDTQLQQNLGRLSVATDPAREVSFRRLAVGAGGAAEGPAALEWYIR